MTMTQISLDNETVAQLDALALARSLSREETLRVALKRLAAYDAWLQEEVNRGIADIEQGNFITSSEAKSRSAERRAMMLAK